MLRQKIKIKAVTSLVIVFTLNIILFSSLKMSFTTEKRNFSRDLGLSADPSDITPPTYSDLTESADPLELGDKELFSIKAYDEAGIKKVEIVLEGNKKNMKFIEGNTWQYDKWMPSRIGNYSYTINVEDRNGNINSTEGSVEVIDTSAPNCIDLTNKSAKLELGDVQMISIIATDISGIQKVYIQLEGQWYLMTSMGGDNWQYDSWIPETIQIHNYSIYVQDNNNIWNNLEGNIEVIDTTMPTFTILDDNNKLELGNNYTLSIKSTDNSGIKNISIEFEENLYFMNNVELDKWEYVLSNLNKTGTFEYKLIIEDNANNTLILYRSFSVFSKENIDVKPNNEIPFLPILGLLAIIGVVSSIAFSVIKVKKSKTDKKLKELSSKNPLKSKKSLILEREHLELEAKNATKLGDYTKAAELYGKCKSISNQLFKDGIKDANTKRNYFAKLETESIDVDATMAITTTCINELLTEFGDEKGIWYYSEPQIYHHSPKMTDGLILNENEYLKSRVDALSHEEGLSSEVGINLFNIEHVKAIQFIYTNNISTNNFLELAINYQTPDTMLFIVCLRWSKYQKNIVLKLPQDSRIKYRENVSILTHDLFKDLIGLDLNYNKQFNKIIKLNCEMNIEGLKKIHDSNEVLTHDTNDLKDDLLKKGLIEKEFCDYFQTPVDINGSEEILLPIPQVGGKRGKKFPKDAATHLIPVICPNCKHQKKIRILDSIVSQAKQLTTISILKGLVCEHGFQFFVDKNFKVRGYQKVDVEVDAANTNQTEIVDESN